MNIFLNDDELEEVKPVSPSEDRGIVIPDNQGKRGENNSDLTKEIAAIDAMIIGPTKSAEINGIDVPSASRYSNGQNMSADSRALVLSKKYQIEDTAVTKLMETLNILNPNDLVKTRDKIAVINGLSNLVDRIADKSDNKGPQQVHLHLYAPNQKKESDYEVIDA